MALDPNVDGVITSRPPSEVADQAEPGPLYAPEPLAVAAPGVATPPKRAPVRRTWVSAVAVGCAGVIAAGTLGYFLYTTAGERDGALHKVDATQAALTSTAAALTATQQDLAARKAVAGYASLYTSDTGRVRIDYQTLLACTTFGSCRTAAQSLLTNLQAFQSDRSGVAIPAGLVNSDAMLRDALSAAIAAEQELISGMDNANTSKIKDGWRKLNAAMLSLAKAEAVLGAELK